MCFVKISHFTGGGENVRRYSTAELKTYEDDYIPKLKRLNAGSDRDRKKERTVRK